MFPIHDENRPSIKPYVNYGFLVVNVAIFFFFFLQGTRTLTMGITFFGAIPDYIVNGERLWTLVTSMFMHADIMHLVGNMVYLWVFGDNIEDALGHIRYLVFYFLGGLAASFTHIASLFVTSTSFGFVGFNIPSVGASGAISAVLGAYLLLYPKARIRTLVFYFFIYIISVPAYYYLGFWFLYQLIMGAFSLTGFTSGVAFWAHLGGFAVGLVTVKFFKVKPRFKRMGLASRVPLRPLVVQPRVRTPFVDVIMERGKVTILAELPGMNKEDIEVEVSEREVSISAEHDQITFYKRILLPTMVIPQVEDFDYRNGVVSFYLYTKIGENRPSNLS